MGRNKDLIRAIESNEPHEDMTLLRQLTVYGSQVDIIKQFLFPETEVCDNLAEEVINERLRFQKALLAQILTLIYEREKTKQKNIASIDSELIKVQGEIFLYKCIVYPISPDNKRRTNLEMALLELENRRRQEEIDFWKDTVGLWQELLKISAEYKATVRKLRMIADSSKKDE
jgi:hypothetical protein